jgi:Bacterial Ig domain
MRTTQLAGHSRFVGRVGVLAVTLGVGVGFATSVPAIAWADGSESSTNTDSTSDKNDAPQSDAATKNEQTPPDDEPEDDPAPEPSDDDEDDLADAEDLGDDEEAAAEDDLEEAVDDTSPVDSPASEVNSTVPTHSGESPRDDTLTQDAERVVTLSDRAEPPIERPVAKAATPRVSEVQPSVLANPPLKASRSFATSNTQNTAPLSAADTTTLAAAQSPVQAVTAIPSAVVNFATGLVASVLSPFLSPGSSVPGRPLTLFAVLDWVRRELIRSFFNRSPNAVADVYTTSEDVGLSGNVLTDGTDDTDADGDALTSKLVTGPEYGDLTLHGDGSFTYTPDADFHGTDTFTYKVSDVKSPWHLHGLPGLFGQGHTDTATVSITVTPVDDPLVARDDVITTNENNTVTFDVRVNDTSDVGGPLTIVGHTQPVNGYVVLNGGDSSFTYVPDSFLSGTETFTYEVTDGVTSQTATVTVIIKAVNDMPVGMGDSYTIAEGTTLVVAAPGVVANDDDIDGDTLTAVKWSDPSNGVLALNPNGSFTYTPDDGFVGVDSFQYTPHDGTTIGTPTYVHITVQAAQLPVAGYDSLYTPAGTPLTIDPDTLLANDFDALNDPLTVVVTEEPESGALGYDDSGNLVYTPAPGFLGVASFQYSAVDSGGDTSDPAYVTINIGVPANTAPIATPDFVTVYEDTPRVIVPSALVGNDSDADGDELAPYVVSQPINGTIESNEGGTFTYTPNPGFSGMDRIYYTAFDGAADSVPVEVIIQVAGHQPFSNDRPVPGYDTLATDIDTPLTIHPDTLSANDFDADNDPIQVLVTQSPFNGTLSHDVAGNLIYTPDVGFTGIDAFYYSAADYEGASLPAKVTIDVGGPGNTAPAATPDTLFSWTDATLDFTDADLVGNDADSENDTLIAYILSDPAHGSLVDWGDGSFAYTSDANYVGTDYFYYTAFDGTADSTPTLVTINVVVPPL